MARVVLLSSLLSRAFSLRAGDGGNNLRTVEQGTFPFWPFGNKVQCGVEAGEFTQKGMVYQADGNGQVMLAHPLHGDPCKESGWSVKMHGDGNNIVDFLENGNVKFGYVAGAEVGTGAGATFCDLASKPENLKVVFTDGLSGCMGLAILGKRATNGKEDLFFAHSRTWSNYAFGKEMPEIDPLHAARFFVSTHTDLRVMYGSGVHALNEYPHSNPGEEARHLSSILGVWVPDVSYNSWPLEGVFALHLENMALGPIDGDEHTVKLAPSADKPEMVQPVWQPSPELIQQVSNTSVPEAEGRRCAQLLRACVAGDYSTLRAISHMKKDFSGQLGQAVDACLSEVEATGAAEYDSAILNFQYSRGTKVKILTPHKPPLP